MTCEMLPVPDKPGTEGKTYPLKIPNPASQTPERLVRFLPSIGPVDANIFQMMQIQRRQMVALPGTLLP